MFCPPAGLESRPDPGGGVGTGGPRAARGLEFVAPTGKIGRRAGGPRRVGRAGGPAVHRLRQSFAEFRPGLLTRPRIGPFIPSAVLSDNVVRRAARRSPFDPLRASSQSGAP